MNKPAPRIVFDVKSQHVIQHPLSAQLKSQISLAHFYVHSVSIKYNKKCAVPYLPHGRSMEILRGRGVEQAKEKYGVTVEPGQVR